MSYTCDLISKGLNTICHSTDRRNSLVVVALTLIGISACPGGPHRYWRFSIVFKFFPSPRVNR